MQLNPNKNTPDKDIVYTPRELAREIIEHYNPTGVILDPCKGDGAFSDQIKDCLWCELELGSDFLDWTTPVDWIISNPPWSKMREFLSHGMEVADNIVYLTSINHYTTKRRIKDMRDAGFAIKEFYCIPTPKVFPQSGFQLAAVHTQRGYTGGISMIYSPNI
jgi:hypothetical protein